MAAESSTTQEILKKRYVDPVEDVVMKTNVLQSKIKFDENSKTGLDYTGAVMLRRPQGHTYAGGSSRNTAFSLNGARTGLTKQVVVVPSEEVLQEQISYGLAASCNGEEAAFNPELQLIIEAMVEAQAWALELQLFFGGTSNIGILNANPSGSAPTGVFQLSKASFSPHIWGPGEGMLVDAYSDAALTTKLTTDGGASVNTVDLDNRYLELTFASNANYTSTVAALGTGVYLVPFGAVGNWAPGVDALITTSAAGGTVFGLNTSLYGLMRATSVALTGGGAATFTKIAQAAVNSANKGGMSDLDVIVNTYSWTDIMNDQAALRQYVGDYGGEFKNGADELTYYGPNGGQLRFQLDPMVKAGEAYILNFDDWRNVGATMPTFNLPNRSPQNPQFMRELDNNAGYELRRYYQIGTYCKRLARQTKITGIVNNSGPTGGGT